MEKEFLAEYDEKMRPVVTVCCLAYNQEEFITEALDGFAKQETTFPFEVIVHDDTSTDRTPEIIREYAARRPDIFRPIFQTENQFSKNGIYPNATHVYPLARGKYIALCDGDDYWTDPHKLQKQVDFMEKNPSFALCYHDYYVKNGGQFTDELKGAGRDYIADELISLGTANFRMATSTILFRNYYNESTRNDFIEFKSHYMFIVLMGTYGGAKYLSGFMPSVYRKHGRNSWAGQDRTKIAAQTKAKVARIRELFERKGNPKWIALREGVE
jgi:glycosyltransferase involved in cell wall biosynthesis